MAVPRINNDEMREYVMSRREFYGSNTRGQYICDLYVVYSYGEHFPMYIYDTRFDKWYGNGGKYSRSTSRHQSQARPAGVDIQWLGRSHMQSIVTHNGIAGLVARRMS